MLWKLNLQRNLWELEMVSQLSIWNKMDGPRAKDELTTYTLCTTKFDKFSSEIEW